MDKPYLISDPMMQTIMQALHQGPFYAVAPVIAELQRQAAAPTSPLPMDLQPVEQT